MYEFVRVFVSVCAPTSQLTQQILQANTTELAAGRAWSLRLPVARLRLTNHLTF